MSNPTLDGNGKPIHYTMKTEMKIIIRSKMNYRVFANEDGSGEATTKIVQKALHRGIARAIMTAVEWARDDSQFDENAIEDMDYCIEGMDESDITEIAEMNLEYKHGGEIWQGERIPTKAERLPPEPQAESSTEKGKEKE